MTERYFTVDRQLVPNISVDGGVVWSQDDISTTLGDTMNEGYVTAEEDTQYLSVLDSTNEISLENLSITLTNPKLEVEETAETFLGGEELIEQPAEETNEQQVVVYTVEGSDELYGIQVVEDEEGNLQKYQFQFRKNKDGQLEAIPETIQLLPMEDEVQEETHTEVLTEVESEEPSEGIIDEHHSMHIFVQEDNSEEHILPDNHHNVLAEEEHDEADDENTMLYENENIEEETVDIKPGILALQNVKQEIQEHQPEFEPEQPMEDEETTHSFPENLDTFHPPPEDIHDDDDDDESEHHLIEYGTHLDHHHHQEENPEENSNPSENNQVDQLTEENGGENDGENFEHVVVSPDMDISQESSTVEPAEMDDMAENNMADSDVDDYHIVEGVHITGDVENGTETIAPEPVTIEKPVVSSSINNTNILRHALKSNKEPRIKRDNKLYLYVVQQHPEKENVDSFSLDMSGLCGKPIKSNPRSILKSSFQAENDTLQEERLSSKRFARGKEAVQARNFHNFINKTTIPQAPIRKNRLPRKQKIKPVERMDEEIVVQEVMVSSNGFIETISGTNKENYLEITDYVELTDSDDDYDPKKHNKKKKKHRKKKIEITISDDSDASSVIELDESDDDSKNKEQEVPKSPKSPEISTSSPTKRRRGRPPKNPKLDASISETESPQKKLRMEPEHSAKPEIPCPKCDKSFPSQNSLKTHLQHHNLQSSLRSQLPEYKYKCDICGDTFKNGILLKKHVCLKLVCAVCKKKCDDLASLNAHKRTHVKEKLIKSTTGALVSPKKVKTTPSDTFKSPKKVNNLKCKTCGKVCSSLQNLNVHMKTHKEYTCVTCSSKFLSQLLLDQHLREKCVKSPKSFRRSLRIKSDGGSSSNEENKPVTRTSVCPRIKCDKCTTKFLTHKALFKHKVLRHGLDTPDKSVLQEPEKKLKGAHSGVPAGGKLRNAFARLKCQLDFDD